MLLCASGILTLRSWESKEEPEEDGDRSEYAGRLKVFEGEGRLFNSAGVLRELLETVECEECEECERKKVDIEWVMVE